MNLQEAITILKLNDFRKIYRSGDSYFEKSSCGDYEVTPREIIKMAKHYTSENNHREFKADVKKYRHKNNRSQTRRLIHNQDFEDFPTNQLAEDENMWNWD